MKKEEWKLFGIEWVLCLEKRGTNRRSREIFGFFMACLKKNVVINKYKRKCFCQNLMNYGGNGRGQLIYYLFVCNMFGAWIKMWIVK